MLRYALATVLLSALLVGCKSRESQVVGTWSGQNLTMTFNEDKTFLGKAGGMIDIGGDWRYENDQVITTTKTIGGRPAEEFLKGLQEQLKANPMAAAMMKEMGDPAESLKKPNKMTLSKDAKSLTASSPDGKQTVTLTKSES